MLTFGHYSALHRWKQVTGCQLTSWGCVPSCWTLESRQQFQQVSQLQQMMLSRDAARCLQASPLGPYYQPLGDAATMALIMSTAPAHSPVIRHLDTQGWCAFFGTSSQMTSPSPSLNAPSFSSWHQIQSPACGCHLLLFVVPRQEPEALNTTGRAVRFSSGKVTP